MISLPSNVCNINKLPNNYKAPMVAFNASTGQVFHVLYESLAQENVELSEDDMLIVYIPSSFDSIELFAIMKLGQSVIFRGHAGDDDVYMMITFDRPNP